MLDGYEYDYGAAGLYAALMLQYRKLTGDARYLDEARKAARKLTSFGFCSGFELNVTALSALTLLRLYRLTGDPQDLEGSYIQLAVGIKHTWLFNPRYERFKDRDLFAFTSCRANLNYANSAEEGMIARLLIQYLREGDGTADRRWLALIADVLRYKAHAWTDGIPALCRDKTLIHAGKPENWYPIDPTHEGGFETDRAEDLDTHDLRRKTVAGDSGSKGVARFLRSAGDRLSDRTFALKKGCGAVRKGPVRCCKKANAIC